MYHTPSLTVEHDLWINSSKECIVGASGGFIDYLYRPRKLVLLAKVKNDEHEGEAVTDLLDEELK